MRKTRCVSTTLIPAGVALLLLVTALTGRSYGQEHSLAEKISDVSPDKKFAMRIWYDAGGVPPNAG
ncbi:MAG: hypothetical protein J2P56_03255 [Verrucomicrobia bacterium]|nr:hypothetical protein [Verrucomicrobiota bacterium]